MELTGVNVIGYVPEVFNATLWIAAWSVCLLLGTILIFEGIFNQDDVGAIIIGILLFLSSIAFIFLKNEIFIENAYYTVTIDETASYKELVDYQIEQNPDGTYKIYVDKE